MPDSQKPRPHIQRWVTGTLVGLPVLVCVTAGPPWSWYLLVSVVTTLGLWEIHGFLFQAPLPGKWLILSFAAGLFMPLGTYLWGIAGLNFTLFISFFAALSLMMLSSPLDRDQIGQVGLLSFAWLYLPYFMSFVLLIGAAPQGRFWILFVLAVTVAGDAGAYHIGSRIGRRKLYQVVSPKKTIEGAIGGLFSSVVAGSAVGFIFLRNVPFATLLFFSLAVAVTGQIGDLIESMLKRNCGKKDSSALLPGHGGILDRLDSLIFSFPVMWALLQLDAIGF
jgi:phosphatidate cytidylyltransferase